MILRNIDLKRILITTYPIALTLFAGVNIMVSLKFNDLLKRFSL